MKIVTPLCMIVMLLAMNVSEIAHAVDHNQSAATALEYTPSSHDEDETHHSHDGCLDCECCFSGYYYGHNNVSGIISDFNISAMKRLYGLGWMGYLSPLHYPPTKPPMAIT